MAAIALAGVLAGAFGPLLAQDVHWSLGAGTALAAGAPLAYLLAHWRSPRQIEGHPLVISILSGLGCVTVMIAIQRFGNRHDWLLYLALAALIVWMLWQRGQRRRPPPGTGTSR